MNRTGSSRQGFNCPTFGLGNKGILIFFFGALLISSCSGYGGRASWILKGYRFEAWKRGTALSRGAFRNGPLKISVRNGVIAVIDGSRWRLKSDSRAMIYDLAGKLAAMVKLPVNDDETSRAQSVFVDGQGRIYILVDQSRSIRILRLTPDFTNSRYLKHWDVIDGAHHATGIVGSGKGMFYIVDGGNHRIIRLPWKGQDPGILSGPRELNSPHGLAMDSNGSLFTQITKQCRPLMDNCPKTKKTGGLMRFVVKYGREGNQTDLFPVSTAEQGKKWYYNDLAVDQRGNIYVADYSNRRIRVFSPKGKALMDIVHLKFLSPSSICLDEEEKLYVADWKARRIFRFSPVYVDRGKRRSRYH